MYYEPHILEKRTVSVTKDSYGRIVTSNGAWVTVCRCRCDDNTIQEIRDDNGKVYRPKYHIVARPHADVAAGDEIRVLTEGGEERASGLVTTVKHLNVLPYSDIWV